MTSLDTAEGVTKFLRSKNASIDEIVTTSTKLLDNSLDIFFPGKKLFVLNLLVDRLNDKSNGKFGEWKYSPSVWKLLISTWDALQDDKLEREKSIQKLKIVEIGIILFSRDNDIGLLNNFFQFFGILSKESYIESDENVSIQFLKSFVEYNHFPEDAKQVLQWSELVRDVYIRSCSKLSLEGSKKLYSKFFEECCLSLITFLTSSNQKSSTPIFLNLLKRGIFDSNSVQYLQSNLERTIKKAEVPTESLIYLYQLAVDELASKNMKLCESIYTSLSDKQPELSEKLLSILAKSGKTISHDFIQSIYKTEVTDKNFKDLNWEMVKYLYQIDSELASSKGSFLFKTYKSSFGLDDKVLPVGITIVDGYVKNRELVDFYTKVWPKAVQRDVLWESEVFINTMANTVKTLSGKQLTSVIEHSFTLDKICQRAVFTAITKGLTSSSVRLVEAVKGILLDHNEFFNTRENFWGIRYYLLCVYGKQFTIPENILKLDVDLYYHFTLFRLLELQVNTEYTKPQLKYFLATIEDIPDVLPNIFKRWLVIFNNFFDTETLTKLISIAYNDIDFNDVFFEQPKLTKALIQFITEDIGERMHLLKQIPIVCFNKSYKKEILDKLLPLAIKSPSKAIFENIKFMLSQATFQSELETNFDNLLQILHACPSDCKNVVDDIFTTIWGMKIQQIKAEENHEYITKSLLQLNKYYTSKNQSVASPESVASLLLLTDSKEESMSEDIKSLYVELRKNFTTFCINNLKKSTKLELSHIDWLLSALVACGEEALNYKDVKLFLANLDNVVLNTDHIQANIFCLICKTISLDFNHVLYVLSLFVALESKKTLSLQQTLSEFLEKILSRDIDLYTEVYSYFVSSLTNVPVEFNYSFLQIAGAFLHRTTKEVDSGHYSSKCFSYFVEVSESCDEKSAEFILSELKDLLTSKSWLFNQYILEITFVIIGNITRRMNDFNNQEKIYILSTQVISHMLLYHRFKVATRHHIVLNVISGLLEPLASDQTVSLSSSDKAGSAFARLLSNLCEPTERVGEKTKHLTTSASYFKKILRKHLPVLLVNYIYFNLKYTFTRSVNAALISGIYCIFDVLSQSELRIVNASLDYSGRAYYKTLYNDYKDHGKWNDQ
ncbi:URB2 Nucleolar pre-ribosomal-associated protein 2 [Candida maltosa Xu316]